MSDEEPLDPIEELLNDQADAAEEFLEGLFELFGLEAEIDSELEDETIVMDVDGADLAVLIGHHGSTIDALQDLARSVANHRTGERASLLLDVGGYRANRREIVRDKGRRVIESVLSSGRSKSLEPMQPYERKAVHDLVADTPGVWSDSAGEEPERYVVIHPGDASDSD